MCCWSSTETMDVSNICVSTASTQMHMHMNMNMDCEKNEEIKIEKNVFWPFRLFCYLVWFIFTCHFLKTVCLTKYTEGIVMLINKKDLRRPAYTKKIELNMPIIINILKRCYKSTHKILHWIISDAANAKNNNALKLRQSSEKALVATGVDAMLLCTTTTKMSFKVQRTFVVHWQIRFVKLWSLQTDIFTWNQRM